MKAICFMQEVKEGDLTIREQMLVCRRALRKLRWPCVLELFAQAGTEEQPLSLRPGMVELLHAAANFLNEMATFASAQVSERSA